MNNRKIIEKKSTFIRKIWNEYIQNYKFCRSKIKNTVEVQSNYFGEIINFIDESLPILYEKIIDTSNDHKKLSSVIAFLQTLYIHQDFIEELLAIFKCKIVRGDLDSDPNFKTNRDIRNELVGHPIRKQKIESKLKLISSTILHYHHSQNGVIAYCRYHIDNNYSNEIIRHSQSDILERHELFLIKHLDHIIKKIKEILRLLKNKYLEINTFREKQNTIALINVTIKELIGEANIEEKYFAHTLEGLLEAEKLINKHIRYQCLIYRYYSHIEEILEEELPKINGILGEEENIITTDQRYNTLRKRIKINNSNKHKYSSEINTLTRLAPRMPQNSDKDWEILYSNVASSLLKKSNNNRVVQEELKNIKDNKDSSLEFGASFYLLITILSNQ